MSPKHSTIPIAKVNNSEHSHAEVLHDHDLRTCRAKTRTMESCLPLEAHRFVTHGHASYLSRASDKALLKKAARIWLTIVFTVRE